MTKKLLSPVLLLLILLCGVAGTGESSASTKDRWISLFNGKNLDGWKIKITGHELNDNYTK